MRGESAQVAGEAVLRGCVSRCCLARSVRGELAQVAGEAVETCGCMRSRRCVALDVRGELTHVAVATERADGFPSYEVLFSSIGMVMMMPVDSGAGDVMVLGLLIVSECFYCTGAAWRPMLCNAPVLCALEVVVGVVRLARENDGG